MGDTLPLPLPPRDGEGGASATSGGELCGASRSRDALLHLLATVGVEPRSAVFVVGCGDGELPLCAAELVGPRGRVLGIDPNPETADATRRLAAARELGQLELRSAEPGALELEERFGAVIAARSALRPVPHELLAALARHLSPKGVLAVLDLEALAAESAGASAPAASGAPPTDSGAAFAPVSVGGSPPAGVDGTLPWWLGRAGLPPPRVAIQVRFGGETPCLVAAWSRLRATPG